MAAFPVFLSLIAYLIYQVAVYPPSWYYSVSARTEAIALALPAERETSWRIEGATLCSTEALDGLSAYPAADSPCGSSRWHAYSLPDGQEQVLVLGGSQPSSGKAIAVELESRTGGGLQMSIRGGPGGKGLGTLQLVDQGVNVSLGNQINLIWKGDARPRDLVFPFIANQVRLGRDVTWSDSSLLQEGKVEIFTASDENLSKRSRVEEAELLPGDQVRLERFDGKTPLQPKGFLRFDRPQPGEPPSALTAIVFGRAEKVRIERFGDSGYDFQPPWWTRVSQNPGLAIISGFIAGLLTLLSVYKEFPEIHRKAFPSRGDGDQPPPDKESHD